MTQEEKELLLKDLCARLPYNVIVKVNKEDNGSIKSYNKPFDAEIYNLLLLNGGYTERGIIYHYSQFSLKPYLRPMSSMTEEEFKDLKSYSGLIYDQLELQEFFNNSKCLEFYLTEIPSYVVILVFDWLNKRHFDYRGLIGMGLALEASEGIYK